MSKHRFNNTHCECGEPATVKDTVSNRMICAGCHEKDSEMHGTKHKRGRPRKIQFENGQEAESSILRKYYPGEFAVYMPQAEARI